MHHYSPNNFSTGLVVKVYVQNYYEKQKQGKKLFALSEDPVMAALALSPVAGVVVRHVTLAA